MKNIDNLHSLTKYGIIVLTGESDPLGRSLLCDVTAAGEKLLAKALGLNSVIGLAAPWNSNTNGIPHIGSILLGRELLQTIGIIALLEDGCHTVLEFAGQLYGLEGDEKKNDYIEVFKPREKVHTYTYGVHGRRNLHYFTGRLS